MVSLLAALSAQAEDELRVLIERAWATHPELTAAQERIVQAESDLEGLAGFFDPRGAIAAGYADQARSLYGLSWNPRDADPDGGVFHAGVEMAFQPGFYAGIGASRQEWNTGVEGDENTSRTGARLRIPLLRNRGFAPWRAQRSRVEAERESADAHLLAVAQKLESEVEERYIDLLLARAQIDVAQSATARADQLVNESEERVRLRAAAEYQAHPARLEAARRREEEAVERLGAESARLQLEELTGGFTGGDPGAESAELAAWIQRTEQTPALPSQQALTQRGDALERLWNCVAQEARLNEARDGLRHDLSLEGGVGWESGEDFNDPDPGAASGESQTGGDISLVWRHAIGDRAARAGVRKQSAALREQRALVLDLERTVLTEIEASRKDHETAIQRMLWIAEAVDSARAALTAEEERFRLGEGTSRNVLDAQKDLTDVMKRQNEIFAEGLRARTRYRAACGAMGEPFKKETR